MLNIVVCMKSVPGVVTGIAISEAGDKLSPASRFAHVNEMDEYALEEALVLRNKPGAQVTALTVGTATADEMLYSAVAKGADRAIRIDTDSPHPTATAHLLAQAIRKQRYDLVLAGLESSDTQAAQVAVTVAELLNIPFVFAVTQVQVLDGKTLKVTREIGGGSQEVVEVQLPALLATQTGIQHLSYAPVAKLFQARRKGIDRLTLRELGIEPSQLTMAKWRFTAVARPEVKHQCQIFEGQAREVALTAAAKIKEAI